MKRYIAVLMLFLSVPAMGQQPPAPGKPTVKPPTPPSAPTPPTPQPLLPLDSSAGGQPVNIRVDVSVTDQSQAGTGQPKTLMVILADRALGQTRAAYEDRSISVDARRRSSRDVFA
jgi:hypothetical protein